MLFANIKPRSFDVTISAAFAGCSKVIRGVSVFSPRTATRLLVLRDDLHPIDSGVNGHHHILPARNTKRLAITVARRVAWEEASGVGGECGFRVAFVFTNADERYTPIINEQLLLVGIVLNLETMTLEVILVPNQFERYRRSRSIDRDDLASGSDYRDGSLSLPNGLNNQVQGALKIRLIW